MDLQAYTQIDDLEPILKELDVEPQRLRGLRLMKFVQPYEDLNALAKQHCACVFAERVLHLWLWDHKTHKGLIGHYEDDGAFYFYDDYDITVLHGKKKKRTKLLMKQEYKKVIDNLTMYNSFCGKDVLHVHTRTGGPNRLYYGMREVEQSKYWLGDCDDYCDQTYCDIYFDISHVDINKYIQKKEEE